MPVTAVVGGQWGDEGKGKIVDTLAAEADLVIRYNGGGNAGHTVVLDRGIFRLHLVPSGIFHPGVLCLIGPGVVVNPDRLLEEIDALRARGIDTSGLRLADRAHLVFPHHLEQDALEEEARGAAAHGTTRQGIWPAYADKAARMGVRVADLFEPQALEGAVRHLAARKGAVFRALYGRTLEADELLARCAVWREALAPYVVDALPLVTEALRRDARIILEGHLGVMRDLDWGVYPYVTSSTCLPAGAGAGAGIPAGAITRVVGVVKAYTTAVGAGPLPTELHDETAARLRAAGHEFGTLTGRPRRCGWFDAVAVRYAAQVAGFTELAVMKVDVLGGFDPVRVCVAYRDGERVLQTVPHHAALARVQPMYEDLPGWPPTGPVEDEEALPAAARAFLDRVEALVGVPVTLVGTGQARSALLVRRAASRAGGRARQGVSRRA
jgi:adenylosuccinate synthase